MRRALALLAVLALTGCGEPAREAADPAVVDGCRDANARPVPANAETIRRATLCLLNARRARHGLQPLVEDAALRVAAERHSADMASRDYFEHRTPEGIEPYMRIVRAGYRARLVGENLAWGEGRYGDPAHAVESWMKSPGHRANVLEPRYTQIGIGLAFDAPEPQNVHRLAAVYTTTFGSASVAGGPPPGAVPGALPPGAAAAAAP